MKKILWAFAPYLLALVLWQIAAESVLMLRGVAFPTPWQTATRLLELIQGDPMSRLSLYDHISASLWRWLAGFAIASVLGISYGLLAGRIPVFEKATARIPQLILMVPGLAWIPVAILLFGIGERATIFMIATAAFAPIAFCVLSGMRSVDIHLVRAARMLGTSRHALFLHVYLPAALPSLLDGLRIGLATGWRVLVAAEMIVGTGAGLGYSLIQARWTMDYTSSFACIVTICGVGLFSETILFRTLEKHTLARWGMRVERP